MDIYYRKVIGADKDQVSLDADTIRLLIASDESKSLNQIAEEVDLNSTRFRQAPSKLLKQGLIEPAPESIPVRDESFLESLRIHLAKAIGPMAEILIADAMDEMDLNSAGIPVNQAAELITQLAREVPDGENQIQFKKSMLAILNKI